MVTTIAGTQSELLSETSPVLYLLGGDGTLRWLSVNLLRMAGVDPMVLLGQELNQLVRFEQTQSTEEDTWVRNGKMRFSDGILRDVQVSEVRREGLPGFGAMA